MSLICSIAFAFGHPVFQYLKDILDIPLITQYRLLDSVVYPFRGIEFFRLAEFIGDHRGDDTDILLVKRKDIRHFFGVGEFSADSFHTGQRDLTALDLLHHPTVLFNVEKVSIVRHIILLSGDMQ